jgi:hypothetical protein
VSARFKGKLLLSNVKAPYSYTIHFDGQGGVAGFGKGSADVALVADGGQTRLSYVAQAQVGGKLAQVGSRLIDAAAGKIAEDFFSAFEATLSAAVPEEPEVAAVAAAPAPAPTAGYPKWVVWAVAGATLLAAAGTAAYWMGSAG